MLFLGTIIIILSSFNLKTIKEVKEIFRISIILLIFITIILYDSIQLDYINNGIAIYNDIFIIRSYTKAIELIIFIITILYIYIIKEYLINEHINNRDILHKGLHKLLIVLLLNILGIILFIQWNNSIVIFITLELQSYTIYIIATLFTKSYNSTKSGLLYFLLGSVGSIFVLLGFTLLYNETGLLNMNDIYTIYNNYNNVYYNTNNIIISYIFILIGLLFKIGTAPFHNWLINIYANTPTIITIWISIITKISILTVLYTLISNSSFLYTDNYNNLLSVNHLISNVPLMLAIISILSIVFGAFGGLGQFTIKRIIGYSGLVNTGYFLFIILSNNNTTLSSYLFNIYQYSLTHIVWFILILVNGLYYSNHKVLNMLYKNNNNNKTISSNINLSYVKDLYGYLFINPYIGFSYIIVISSLIGIPPLTGFYAKLYILLTGINSSYLFISILVLLSSAFTAYYYLFIIKNLIITDRSNTNSIINIWKSVYKNSSNTLTITPILSLIISIIIMSILGITIGLDIANNGTHIVEWYNINHHV